MDSEMEGAKLWLDLAWSLTRHFARPLTSPDGRGRVPLLQLRFADCGVSGLIRVVRPVEAQALVLFQMELQGAHPAGVFVAGRQERGQGGQNFLAPGKGVGQGVEDVGDQHGRRQGRRGVFFR